LEKCTYCGKTTIVDYGYGPYCRTCCRNTTVKFELKHVCNLCSEKFANEILLNKHIRKIHLLIVYSCPICEKTYENLECIAEHFQDKHEIDIQIGTSKKGQYVSKGNKYIKNMWICKSCQQSFNSIIKFNRHYKNHKNL
jgi:hypothetical protein